MELSIIIVNYKSRDYLEDCLSSINKQLHGLKFEIIIVNNDELILNHPFFKSHSANIIEINQNIGFAKACNKGAKAAKGNLLFFLNPDTTVQSFDYIQIAQKFNKNAGIVAPQILLQNGKIQPWSAGSLLTFWRLILNNFGINKDLSISSKKNDFDWVSGAGMIIPRQIFQSINGFDEKFFMYFEDMDLCLRIKKLGYKIERDNKSQVLHVGGQSYDDKRLQKRHYYKSQDLFFKKHHGSLVSFLVKIIRNFLLFLKQ